MDVWADEDPSGLAQIKREHENAGYLDGITSTKETCIQEGFDKGYPYGASLGLKAGKLVGKLQGLGLDELEKKATTELSASSLFSRKFYDRNAEPLFDGEHPEIQKWDKLVASLEFASNNGPVSSPQGRRREP